jgi:hypothetical protein
MPIILPRYRGLGKPPVGAQINWGHPLAKDLKMACLFNEQTGGTIFPLLSPVNGLHYGTWVTSPKGSGVAYNGSTSSYSEFATHPILANIGDVSTVLIFRIDDIDTALYPALIDKAGGDGYASSFPTHLYVAGTNKLRWNRGNALNSEGGVETNLAMTEGTWYHAVGTSLGTLYSIYFDGKLDNTNTYTTTPVDSGNPLRIAKLNVTSEPQFFVCEYTLVQLLYYHRALTANEVAWLYAEPYCFLQPVARRFYSIPSGIQLLVGASDGVAAVSGAAKLTQKVTGSVAGAATVSGATKIAKKLGGTISGVAEVLASLMSKQEAFIPITPTKLTVSSPSAWTDVDTSSLVPAGASGVILHIVNTGVSAYALGLRPNGVTDNNRYGTIYQTSHTWALVGVDSNRILEAYVGSTTYIELWLVGYVKSWAVTFFTSPSYYDKTPATAGSWQTVNCATECPNAIGLIFEIQGGSTAYSFGLQKYDSSDNRGATTIYHNTFGFVVGCDSSQRCEAYVANTAVKMYLVGYITAGVEFYTTAVNESMSTTGSWLDLPSALPAGATMGFIDVISAGTYNYGLRQGGTSETIYRYSRNHGFGIVACSSPKVIQGEISNAAEGFWLLGYAYVTNSVLMQGLSDGVAAVLGLLGLRSRLAGSSAGVGAVAGAMNPLRGMRGTIAGIGAVSGAVNLSKKIAGTIGGSSLVTSAIKLAKKIAGASDGVASVTGNILKGKFLAVVVSGAATVSGGINYLIKLTGIIAGTSSVAGTISKYANLRAMSDGLATVTGLLGALGTVDLDGIISGLATVSASIKTKVALRVAIAGNSVVANAGVKVIRKLAVAISGVASVVGVFVQAGRAFVMRVSHRPSWDMKTETRAAWNMTTDTKEVKE